MIIPAYNCGDVSTVTQRVSVRLVTCKLGTYCELWHNEHRRPVKNGKLFLINTKGELVLFKNPNKIHISITKDPNTKSHVIKVTSTKDRAPLEKYKMRAPRPDPPTVPGQVNAVNVEDVEDGEF